MREYGLSKRTVYFFDRPGEKNTEDVIAAVAKRVGEGEIEAVVIASVSGRTAIGVANTLKRRNLEVKLVCVSGPPSWEKYAPQYEFPLISQKERTSLNRLGVEIVDHVQEPFRPMTFRDWWEKRTLVVRHPESDLFWMTLIGVGGHGFRTAIDVVFMAVEAKAVRPGRRVIGTAGTGRGLDAAVVLKAVRFEDAVGRDPARRLKVEEVLAMSKQTTWTGYG